MTSKKNSKKLKGLFKRSNMDNAIEESYSTQIDHIDPISLLNNERNLLIGQVLGLSKTLSLNGIEYLISHVFYKQNTTSLSTAAVQAANLTKKDKEQDRYLIQKIKPLLDKLDNLGLDYLRIHLRDMIHNLGTELKEKMLFKRFEIRLLEKLNTIAAETSQNLKNVKIEIADFLDKNEIRAQFKSVNDGFKILKEAVLNTKNKIVTIIHNDEKEAQKSFSMHENNYISQVFGLASELETD